MEDVNMDLEDINVIFASDNLKMKDMKNNTIYAVYQCMGFSTYALFIKSNNKLMVAHLWEWNNSFSLDEIEGEEELRYDILDFKDEYNEILVNKFYNIYYEIYENYHNYDVKAMIPISTDINILKLGKNSLEEFISENSIK